ncbi:MAG: T9SS type A sorting domain-containing protein [Bacteroidota bacterium]
MLVTSTRGVFANRHGVAGIGAQDATTSLDDVPIVAFATLTLSGRVTVSFQGCVFSDEVTFVPPIEGGTSLSGLADRELPPSNLELQEVKVFPNPTTGELNFMGLPITGHTVTIIDNQGKAIVQDSPVDQSLSIRDYPSGIYHFIIQNAEGIVKSGRIIKE